MEEALARGPNMGMEEALAPGPNVQEQAFVEEEETQKLLRRPAKQCEAMKAPLQKSSTAQNAHILQIQIDGASTTQQVKLLDKQHEQMRTEEENTNESMTTLEARVKEMYHEHSKLKDNECAWMEINGQQMLALTEDVAQQSKATNVLEAKLNEIEKLNTTAVEGNRAAESDAESKRREPIFSPASAMQTAAKVNNRAESNRGTHIPSPASAMQTARQEDTRQLKSTDSKRRSAMACLEQRQTTAMACLEQRLESFTRDQSTLRAEMLQETAMLCEGKNSLAQLQQRLEKMEGQMQQQAEAMDDFQDVLEERMDEVQQQVRESDAKTLYTLGTLDSKIDKLTHVEEKPKKMHTAHFMDLQEVTTTARGKIHEFEREVERLRTKGRTVNRQLRQEVDCIFRNELEKIKDNELASIADQQPHTRTLQSMQNRHNSSRKEESELQQGVKTVHQQLPSSPVCFKSNTLLPCLLKLLFQKAYGKGGVSVWGYVRYRCASANSLCRKLFEKGGVWSVFRSAIMSTDYRLGSSWVLTSTGPNRDQQQRGGND